ncbi:heat-inducible transcription repressor HrcA [Flexivirga endophytica]|uniref:Heat-inducible transcription repressor HrcA n=1 Tax=Flexivirga endophytica TaxID=1849103 RepID=A0A916TEX2_9MICO|nr:heat-inducible transcriptional repressor HrcA [Flexivirga endophytica]GGB41024.1 heat-inducible transcription repressor HrcA [Flexivirga endophytica]GHB48828.1 heat-inducible transcription repressor HrcA [Flexivirga endophytica]
MSGDDRRLQVLRAIVQDYVSTSEPVGSKALLERHQLGVSAATVRNDMAALEDEGLIAAPHTSAGRIPTDAGYRLYVDKLSQIKPLSRAERNAIETFLVRSVDLDDVISRTVRLLSTLTGQAAVVQYPSLNAALVRHVELVPRSAERLTLVVILSTGQVDQRIIELDRSMTEAEADELIQQLRAGLNEKSVGLRRAVAANALREWSAQMAGQAPDARPVVVDAVAAAFAEEREDRVVLGGTANLVRSTDFALSLGPLLDALEEHMVLLRLLTQQGGDPTDGVAVRIGTENSISGLAGTSVVSTAYDAGSYASLGVLGPTRMDYPSTMAAVRAVARYVADILDQ